METDTWHIPELDRSGLRKFGITTGAMVVALFGLLFPWLLEVDYPRWPWVLLLVVVLATMEVDQGDAAAGRTEPEDTAGQQEDPQ